MMSFFIFVCFCRGKFTNHIGFFFSSFLFLLLNFHYLQYSTMCIFISMLLTWCHLIYVMLPHLLTGLCPSYSTVSGIFRVTLLCPLRNPSNLITLRILLSCILTMVLSISILSERRGILVDGVGVSVCQVFPAGEQAVGRNQDDNALSHTAWWEGDSRFMGSMEGPCDDSESSGEAEHRCGCLSFLYRPPVSERYCSQTCIWISFSCLQTQHRRHYIHRRRRSSSNSCSICSWMLANI